LGVICAKIPVSCGFGRTCIFVIHWYLSLILIIFDVGFVFGGPAIDLLSIKFDPSNPYMLCPYIILPQNCVNAKVGFENEVLEKLSIEHDTEIPALIYIPPKNPPPYHLTIKSYVRLDCNLGLYSIQRQFTFATLSNLNYRPKL
jgi:hypothetical protein